MQNVSSNVNWLYTYLFHHVQLSVRLEISMGHVNSLLQSIGMEQMHYEGKII